MPKAGRAAGDGPADAAQADDAERLAVEALAQRQRAFGPGAGAHEALALDDAPHARQDQREGHVGDILGQHVRSVGDPDSARPRAVEIDRVEADAETGDDLELRTGVDELRAGAEHAVGRDGPDRAGRPRSGTARGPSRATICGRHSRVRRAASPIRDSGRPSRRRALSLSLPPFISTTIGRAIESRNSTCYKMRRHDPCSGHGTWRRDH